METITTPFVSRRVSALAVETAEEMLFWDGFSAYIEGQPLQDMPTPAQERGWWSANSAEAHTSVPFAFATKDAAEYTDEYESWMEDVEWIARGC